MRFLLLTAGLLFLSIFDLPIGYYTFLRIVVTIASVIVISSEIKNGINTWVVIFGIITIIFNPVLPIYLNEKAIWIPIDIAVGILFLIRFFTLDRK